MKTFTRIEPTTVYEVGDRFKQQVVVKRFRTDDGLEHEFTTFFREGAEGVATIALTPDNQAVVVRQFRAAPEDFWYELPGGGVEDGEDIEAAAKRELFEETGYQPTAITYLGANTLDGMINFVCHAFLATGCVPVGDPARDQTEIDQGVETVLISIDQLIENAKTNQMTDAVAVLMAYDTLKELQGGEI